VFYIKRKNKNKIGTVSFSEMCHPNMSGGKQKPIRQKGRCHHWPLKSQFPVNGPGDNHSQEKKNQGPMMAPTLSSDWPFFHHSYRGGTFH